MKHDMIVDSEAMSVVEGTDVTHLVGSKVVVDLQDEPQRSAFNGYRVAFRENEAEPNLRHAQALVAAWDRFATVMGLDEAC